MGLFRDKDKIERLYFDPTGMLSEKETPDWIDVRHHISYSTRIDAEDAAMSGGMEFEAQNRAQRRAKQASQKTKAAFSTRRYSMTLLLAQIAAWSEDVDINEPNIGELPELTISGVMEKLDDWNAGATEEEQAKKDLTSSRISRLPDSNGQAGQEAVPAGLTSSPT